MVEIVGDGTDEDARRLTPRWADLSTCRLNGSRKRVTADWLRMGICQACDWSGIISGSSRQDRQKLSV